MLNFLSPEGQAKLLKFLETDPLLAFDYDGTLCPIVERAEDAVLRPRTRRLCADLSMRAICVLITGRARSDALLRMDGVPFSQIVGNHGAEWAAGAPLAQAQSKARHLKQVARWKSSLVRAFRALAGVEIEDKSLSLSVHYRHAQERDASRVRIAEVLARLKGARIIGGKEVFNVLPHDVEGKGSALCELKRRFGTRTAVYIGDDDTDEEVFTLPEKDGVFKIRVGLGHGSRADYFLPAQTDIDFALEMMVSGRAGCARSGAAA